MQGSADRKSNITFISTMSIFIIIASILFIAGLFWYQSKMASTAMKSNIKNMQNTAEKATALQKQINKDLKKQEDFFKSLDNQ